MYKKILCIILFFTLSTTLCACAKKQYKQETENPANQEQALLLPGYKSTEIDNPDWVYSWGQCEVLEDVFYMIAYPNEGGLSVASYNTISGDWERYDMNTDPLIYPSVEGFSVIEKSVWILLRENDNAGDKPEYYLLFFNRITGELKCNHIDYQREEQPYLFSFIAVDSERALIGDGEKAVFIDSNGMILDIPEIPVMGEGRRIRVNNVLYIDTADGLAPFDVSTLQYGEPIEEVHDMPMYSSNLGHLLVTENNTLYSISITTRETEEILSWFDVALSSSRLYGQAGLENSNGEILHLTDRLTKITKAEIPCKKTLYLGCFGDTSDDMYKYVNTSYLCTDALKDAIIRFNNTDLEYRVEVRPLIYHSEGELEKLLIELATGNDIDILDTSLLPRGAIDENLLVDLMPYIDNDDIINRSDFIPSLLVNMQNKDKLYEFVDRYTILTLITHPEFAKTNKWTADYIKILIDKYPEMRIPTNQNQLITFFSWAATAEFIDWNHMTCNFNNPVFTGWLDLIQSLSARKTGWSQEPFLFNILYDFAWNVGPTSRRYLQDDYVPIGFPDSSASGSYFMRLGVPELFGGGSLPEGLISLGCSTSIGMMASGSNYEGSWRFIRTFMLGKEEPNLNIGIPVLKEEFERAVRLQLRKAQDSHNDSDRFQELDAEYLRSLVYNTTEIVCSDPLVNDTIATQIRAFLAGKGTAEETASIIQSKMSLYLAEQK